SDYLSFIISVAMYRTTAALLCLATVAVARHAWEFSADAETLLSAPLTTTFTCEGRNYGYFADMDNNCQVFHVCLPIGDENGEIVETAHFSFVCGNQTVFSQESLTCSAPEESFPCEESATLYDIVNSEFGRILEEN
ncbi:hypothetical protein SK128_002857, partial [Halocaridina rubra]